MVGKRDFSDRHTWLRCEQLSPCATPTSNNMVGTRLGHYDISGRLGAGGMGEVFLATDSTLGRAVAITAI